MEIMTQFCCHWRDDDKKLRVPCVPSAALSCKGRLGFTADKALEIDTVDPRTGQFTQIVALDPNYLGPIVFRKNDNTAMLAPVLPSLESYLVTVNLLTGKTQEGPHRPDLFFICLAFDNSTSQTFALVVNTTGVLFSQLYEIFPNQTLRKMSLPIPGLSGQNSSTYSSSKHVFFFVPADANRLLSVLTVGDREGTILYNVSLAFQIQSMAFDDTFGVLYAWGANSTHRTIFMSVDYTTGNPIKTFFVSSTLSAGEACVDKSGTVAYSSLLDESTGVFVIHTLDLSSGKAAQVPTDRLVMALTCQ